MATMVFLIDLCPCAVRSPKFIQGGLASINQGGHAHNLNLCETYKISRETIKITIALHQ